jgi:cob(I)alamin adenosyltransferase
MVILTKIYTRTGDSGTTSLGNSERRVKYDLRVKAYGAVDETNAAVGAARCALAPTDTEVDVMLGRIQNDLFDLGADLCTPEPEKETLPYEPLRIVEAQVMRLEAEIDRMNADMPSLTSFVLPGGTAASAALHMARTIARRAECRMVELAAQENEVVSPMALKYINRLSDHFFVASRYVNGKGRKDLLWQPGHNRG